MSATYPLVLFERLLAGGEEALLSQLQQPDAEHTFIDFKNAATPSASYTVGRLVDSDKKTLGESLSGFANSMGGVVVWGIDCRGVSGTARHLRPGLDDAQALKATLNTLIGSATVPGLAGVRLEVIPLPTAGQWRGALLMYVPRREFGPVRASTKDTDRYYFRAGDQFLSVPHDVLAAMFGRSPPAEMSWKVVGQGRPALAGDALVVEVGVLVVNNGLGLAHFPFLDFTLSTPADTCSIEFSQVDEQRFEIHSTLRHFLTFIGKPGHPLPPGAKAAVCTLKLTLRPPFTRSLVLEATVGAEGALRRVTERRVELADLRRLYSRARRRTRRPFSQTEVWSILFPAVP